MIQMTLISKFTLGTRTLVLNSSIMCHMLSHRAHRCHIKYIFYRKNHQRTQKGVESRYHDAKHSNYWQFLQTNIYICQLKKKTAEMDQKNFFPGYLLFLFQGTKLAHVMDANIQIMRGTSSEKPCVYILVVIAIHS